LRFQRIGQGPHHVLLPHHFREIAGAVLASEHEIRHAAILRCGIVRPHLPITIVADGPSRMVKRPTGSGGEPSSPNCGVSAGVKARQPHLRKVRIHANFQCPGDSQSLILQQPQSNGLGTCAWQYFRTFQLGQCNFGSCFIMWRYGRGASQPSGNTLKRLADVLKVTND